MLNKTRTTIIALVASASFVVASVAPAASQAAMKAGAAGGCMYKGQETSNGGVVLQDDGIYYKCVNGTWVYDHKKARESFAPPEAPTKSPREGVRPGPTPPAAK
jgi:hypothetical protein